MNKFLRKLFFLKLGLITTILPFNPIQNLHSETLNKSVEDNINEKINLQEDPYILGPGDELRLAVLDSDISSGAYTILNDGTINIPLAGDVSLKGKTIKEANSEIKQRLKKQLIEPEVSIQIIKPRPMTVFVLGEVDRPGIYTLNISGITSGIDSSGSSISGMPTLIKAIQKAGGITQSANLKEVELTRLLPGNKNEYKTSKLNLINLIFKGARNNNPFLFDGDIIKLKKSTVDPTKRIETITYNNLSPNQIKISVIGEVLNPGRLQLDSNTPLLQSILEAGGPINSRSSKTNVDLFRVNRDGTASHKKFKLDFKSGISPSNPLLKNGDVVRVRRNLITKASDSLDSIARPLSSVVTVYSLFKIID
ncbi:Hypothetical protein P9515_13851 [Prochlorococcus marinus str. MIT 9515]|uniref:Polysaccharide export protein n=1 Tax=Prochlorococcus marinus (strain MIT 9515) TaxID=167542 RepID=A2BXT1_PROM5|nr:polysaccharide biosynthesis/export family protein [Prochlorococcus marinus]ABM72592.1 Hypothetical protein P9515_13851 [Prochlorococcus marinus str. MIT 9515]